MESESGFTLDSGIMLLAVLILTMVHPEQLCQTQSWKARREVQRYQAETAEDKLQGDKAFSG
jgi:hypothetical protein